MVFDTLYEFTEAGLDAFERVFTGELDDSAIDLSDASLVRIVPNTNGFAPRAYETAKEMAEAILSSVGNADLFPLLQRTGLWAWLTFVLRHQLFKRDASGRWKVGEIHRWYPSDPNDWQKGQRHLVRMPVLLLYSLGDNADHLLCSPPSVLPEIREQLTSQQDMFNPAFQQVARELYFDDNAGGLKRGAGGKGGGSPRRLARVRQQLDVTWDLEDLNAARIIATLPNEFHRFGSAMPDRSPRTRPEAASQEAPI
ncbi:hypothetical protein [Mesorhizobium sp.]|uniref:hypothetical protein n=1 Tax=Mesorhizobium sp. TaxID=1871066 RepID=UPI0025D06FB3|nr:hypothetical protein [Mesorhizobium sp.]